jgi:3-dehydroquinate synthetase
MAEVIKHGIIADADLFGLLEQNSPLHWNHALLPRVIRRCVEIKAAVVAGDERETSAQGGRALLNLGHTFGHAIEATAGYGTYLHGEAVAIGLVMAARLSAELKHCTAAQAEQVEAALKSHALPTALRTPLPLEPMLAAMRRDKKVRGGKLRFVLQDGIGAASTADSVPEEAAVRALLAGGAVR